MNWRKYDWTALGLALRESVLQTHGETIDVRFAYGFLLDTPDLFSSTGDWPDEMPHSPPPALIAAYLGGANG